MSQSSIEKRRNSPELGKLSICIWLAVIPVFMPGCGLGPSMMRANHLTYNDAVQFTERRELLLNIVRLRYNDGPEFLATNSISTQFSIDLSAAAGGQVGEDQALRTNLFNRGGTAGYSERPTITFTPRNEKEFTRELISPKGAEFFGEAQDQGCGGTEHSRSNPAGGSIRIPEESPIQLNKGAFELVR